MSTIYQKIKGAADKKRRSFVSLESKDGTVSPTKLNQTLVEGSKGLSKKFVNHSNALMDGYESTLNADGASFGDDLKSDGKGDNPFGKINFETIGLGKGPGKYKSVAKKTKREGDFKNEPGKPIDASVAKSDPEEEAKKALKTTRTKREGDFKNEDGDKLDVTDVVTLEPGSGKKSLRQAYDDALDLGYREENESFEDYVVRAKKDPKYGTSGSDPKETKSVEMNTSEEDKIVKTDGTEKTYNMGWMESRNAKKAQNVQMKQAKKLTKKNEKLIKKHERNGGTSDSERMSPELRAAYAHFTEDSAKSKFDTKIGSTTGRDTEGTSTTSTNTVQGSDTAITLDANGNPITKYKSAPSVAKFAPLAAIAGKALMGAVASKAADKLTGGPKYKMRGPLYKNNKK